MNSLRVLLAIFILSLCLSLKAVPSKAASKREISSESDASRHELILGVNPYLGFGGRTTGGNLFTDLSDTFVFSIAADYHYAFAPMLQLGVTTSYSHAATGGSARADFWQVMAGPTFNIPLTHEWIYNSLFLSLKGGLLISSVNLSGLLGSSTDVLLSGEFGYRLKLMEHVTWSPAFGSMKVLNGSKFIFIIRPLSFSFVF